MILTPPEKTFSAHRQRKHAAMVEAILAAARAIMREQGVAALSMQELARRMDLRAPSLYHYFAGKMELYDALFRAGFSLFSQRMQADTAGASSWPGYVRASFESYLRFALDNPDLFQLCFERPVPGFIPSAESMALSLEELNRSYRKCLEFQEAMHSGLSPERTVDLLISMMHGLTALHLSNQPELPAGAGRFGSLIPAALDLLEKAWA